MRDRQINPPPRISARLVAIGCAERCDNAIAGTPVKLSWIENFVVLDRKGKALPLSRLM
jgi:hypothetical protein